MNKSELAMKIFDDITYEYHDVKDIINHQEDIIKDIEETLGNYLIIDGGNILLDDEGRGRY